MKKIFSLSHIKKIIGWYPITRLGWMVTIAYTVLTCVVSYIQNNNFFSKSGGLDTGIILTCMGSVVFVMFLCYISGEKPYLNKKAEVLKKGFSLIELLVVISIIGILSAIILPVYSSMKEKAYFVKAKKELRSIRDALEMWYNDYNNYPADADRSIPPGLEAYLGPGVWPLAAWPLAVFDWDSWTPSQLSYNPKQQVYQISIRFCPIGGPLSACRFPRESWAADFGINSAVYYCVSGPCRSHSSSNPDPAGAGYVPGYCVGGECPEI